jgi:hypothetical protein
MTNGLDGRGFVIDGLTRTGSTTLTRLLNSCTEVQCLMEPFHPKRYGGHFYRMAIASDSVGPALNLIWHRWAGIKHVWETDGWPFLIKPELNNGVVLSANKVLYLQRRNLLRRCISSLISKQLRFWVGTKQEFVARLEQTQLCELRPDLVLSMVRKDKEAAERRLWLLNAHSIPFKTIVYENMYGETISLEDQRQLLNEILVFLGLAPVDSERFVRHGAAILDPRQYRWGSEDIYRRIPGIEIIEREVGSDETGWLFK